MFSLKSLIKTHKLTQNITLKLLKTTWLLRHTSVYITHFWALDLSTDAWAGAPRAARGRAAQVQVHYIYNEQGTERFFKFVF